MRIDLLDRRIHRNVIVRQQRRKPLPFQILGVDDILIIDDPALCDALRTIRRLQEQGLIIEGLLKNIEEPVREALFDKIVRYELSIPRLGETLRYEQVQEAYEGKWKSLYDWFVGENGENEVDRLYGITNDIIRGGEERGTSVGADAVSDHLCECVVFLRRGTDGRLESEYALAAGQLYRHRRSQRLWEEHERCFADGRAGWV